MKFKTILSRLTGLSCPWFGISWNPTEAEIIIATRIIRFLEDKRVLFNPSEMHIVLNLPFEYENILPPRCKV